jgi:hypothetical protein
VSEFSWSSEEEWATIAAMVRDTQENGYNAVEVDTEDGSSVTNRQQVGSIDPQGTNATPTVDERGSNDTPITDEQGINDTPMADEPGTIYTPMVDEPGINDTPTTDKPGNNDTPTLMNKLPRIHLWRVAFELFCCVRCCFILFLSVFFLLFLSWSNL